ncbi:HAMP domain-containing sensor histidine kinase [Filomicrobium sp.]|uniref:HAMP domain-containing sensor histidine kinase n=1 Tax=Filomicrobium sp. TaxID=2024831 RepID=UPI00258E2CE0|nr:HAMP domain-containing sensor histidine kinase [Filomicrobium sp.]MCV0370841.1 HAMP domain-containing histidine kinase [Filomicrobium sp.]
MTVANKRTTTAFYTTVFGVTAAAVVAFLVVAALVVAGLVWQTNKVLSEQVLRTLSSEAQVLSATEATGGLDAITRAINVRSELNQSNLYYLTDATGSKLAGNLSRLPSELADGMTGGVFDYTSNGKKGGWERIAAGLPVRLSGGGLLIVARDIEDQRALAARIRILALIGFGCLGVGGLVLGLVIGKSVLSRVEGMRQASRAIMAGDLAQRLPRSHTGDELDRLAESFNTMLSRIEQLMTGFREVSDNIAHDLKTPLNRLRNRAEATLRDATTSQELQDGLGQTIEAADEIIKTFDALLLIARLEAGAVSSTLEPVDIGALIRDAVELYEPVADDAGLALTSKVEHDVKLNANRRLVAQAIANLIDNAIKYSSRRSRVDGDNRLAGHVEVNVRRCGGNRVEISVSDDGPGIEAVDRQRVVERFVRLEESRTAPGTGLGLSLVSAVARLHGGAIRLEDNKPGLRAVVDLPAGP